MRKVGSKAAKNSTLALLFGLSVVALILRYPQGHETGVDSFEIHGIAGAIVITGSMGWLVNPLSYLGLAPFSYSPAVPVSIASFTEMAGSGMEPAIMVYSLFLAVCAPWTAFLAGKSIVRHEGAALLFAFLFATAGGMISFTDWTLSTRGTFLVLTPLALAWFVKSVVPDERPNRNLLPLVLILATLALVHALWLLLIPLLVVAWVASRLVLTQEALLRHRVNRNRRYAAGLAVCLAVGISFTALILSGPAQSRVLVDTPQIRSSLIPDNIVTEIGLQYASVMGGGILLFPIGLVKLILLPEGRLRYALLGLSLAFVPTSLDPVYGILLAIPMILLVSSLAFLPTRRRELLAAGRTPTKRLAVAVVLAALVIILPLLVTIPRTSGVSCQQPWMLDGQTYNAGLYARYLQNDNSSFVWDDGIEASRIQAISGVPAVEPLESIGTLEYPWLARKMSVHFTLEPDLVTAIVKDHQLLGVSEWLSMAGLSDGYFWGKHTLVLLRNSPDSPAAYQILGFYRAHYAVQRCGGTQSTFYTYLHSSNYLIYSDEFQRTYLI